MARVAMLPPEHRGDIAERYLAEIARLMALRRHLRQVRHGQDLAAITETAQ